MMQQTNVLLKRVVTIVVASSWLVAFPAGADNAGAWTPAGEAYTWLNKMQSAAHTLDYSGKFVYQQGSRIRSSRISHRLDGKNEIEKLEVLDGRAFESIRQNDEIVSYIPHKKSVLFEKRLIKPAFPSFSVTNTSQLPSHYKVGMEEPSRVAGFPCHTIVLEPKDPYRYGYRFCAEARTGLMLKAQVLNERREIVEQISFSDLKIGPVDRKQLKPSFAAGELAGWRAENAVSTQASEPGEFAGWVPPGFRKTQEIKRVVTSPDTAVPFSSGKPSSGISYKREVGQIVFSDGLAAISVFIEPYVPTRTEGSLQQGAMNLVSKRHGDFWLIIVGEVPYPAIKKMAQSIEFRSQ